MKVKVKDWLRLTKEEKLRMLGWISEETKRAVRIIDDYYEMYPDID